jgi:uncharacterized protein with FMN-binding domain
MLKRVIVGVICVCVVTGVIFCGRYLYQTWKYKKIIADIVIEEPDLTAITDGIYHGSFDAILVAADVSVKVEDKKIANIVIDKHKNERGRKAEAITAEVISAQSLKVDTISGATNSSKVILKAIDNALNNGSSEE